MIRTGTSSIIHVSLLALSLFISQAFFALTARAEDSAPASNAETRSTYYSARQNAIEAYREKQRALEQELKDRRAEAEAEIKAKRAQLASTSAAIHDTIKENRGDRKDAVASSSEARRNSIEARVAQKRAEMKEKEAKRNEELRSKLAQKGAAQYETVTKRLLAAIERLHDISGRIDSRIEKLAGEQIDMSKAKALSLEAKAAITTAEAAVHAIPAPVFPSSTDASTTPSMVNDALKPTRESAYKAQASITAAQKALGAVVVEIKRAGGSKADTDISTSGSIGTTTAH